MKAVIFDMDGTMVDNMMVHHKAWQEILEELGLALEMEEVRQQIHGINEEILKRLFGERFSDDERRDISWRKESQYRDIFLKDLRLIPGCLDFLEMLKTREIPMAIASAAPPENVDFVIDNLDIRGHFRTILHSKSVTKGKPDPEIYLKTCDALGQVPQNCLVFEDTPTGAKAASNAGCPIVVVTTTHTEDEFSDIAGIISFVKDFKELDINNILPNN
jgi:beta-phosphoglucomutase